MANHDLTAWPDAMDERHGKTEEQIRAASARLAEIRHRRNNYQRADYNKIYVDDISYLLDEIDRLRSARSR